jgi:hypothetical protein
MQSYRELTTVMQECSRYMESVAASLWCWWPLVGATLSERASRNRDCHSPARTCRVTGCYHRGWISQGCLSLPQSTDRDHCNVNPVVQARAPEYSQSSVV